MDDTLAVDVKRVAQRLGLQPAQVRSVTTLLDAGNTVPFITRYRKEWTGNLDEEQIRAIREEVRLLRQVAVRAQTILRLIDAQGKLTDHLRQAVEAAGSLKHLEDLYLPFRPKRTSRAMMARQRGLESLANRIWNRDPELTDLKAAAQGFFDPEKGLAAPDDALAGAADILAERISEDVRLRNTIRRIVWQTGKLVVSQSKSATETAREFQNYFDYSEAIRQMPPHRILAINRGVKVEALRVKLAWDVERGISAAEEHFSFATHRFRNYMSQCVLDAIQRLISPTLEREVRRELTERAESHAILVFARNLRQLLLQPPLAEQRILAIDPGFRTGCKVAVLDECGRYLASDVVYVTGSSEKRAAAVKKLGDLMHQYDCTLIAIGNGTACRETEELASLVIQTHCPETRYVIVNEAGASIYSTSRVAREEFPDCDATVRGTVSIGRRLQDPLSELVKIEPQHIGVGMYQHDISPKRLKESLDAVVESCVNFVGVDLNTASASLLRNVSGFNQLIARRVVDWRAQHGRFTNRRQLLEIAGIGEATFTQAAGFLKILGGDEPLDRTWIHPESYNVAYKLFERLSVAPDKWSNNQSPSAEIRLRLAEQDTQAMAQGLQVGLPTLSDIVEALLRPGRDPRTDLQGPVFKKGILNLEDLEEGMELTGTILNVVDFGAFVDIGLKVRGLVHISELSAQFVRSPHDVVAVGDVVTVWVIGIDSERERVSLTLVKPGTPKTNRKRHTSRARSHPKTTDIASERTAEKKEPDDRVVETPRREEQRRPLNQKTPRPTLSSEMLEGREPLRGFDELKELWQKRTK